MNILESYAQVIAETTHSIIGFDTLITDDHGIIIGSNHPDRTGKMHAHSIVVIRRGMAESIDDQKAGELGVRPGVCLPIRLGNEIVGTVGIAGSPVVSLISFLLMVVFVLWVWHSHRTSFTASAVVLCACAASQIFSSGMSALTWRHRVISRHRSCPDTSL